MNILLLDCCTKVVKMMEKVMHYVCEANATNCNDVEITKCICGYILWIAIVAAATFLAWKIIEQIANGVSVWYKRQCEVEDIERKAKAEVKDRENSIEDERRKLENAQDDKKRMRENAIEDENRQLKRDYLSKKLEILKELSYADDSKKMNKEAAKEYIKAINEAIAKI